MPRLSAMPNGIPRIMNAVLPAAFQKSGSPANIQW